MPYLGPLGLLLPKTIWLSNILALSVHNEGYSRNVSCALNLISTFLLLHSDNSNTRRGPTIYDNGCNGNR